MRTYSPKPGDIQREWHVIDATDVRARPARRPGRQPAARQAQDRSFAPHVDTGDFVIVVNAEKVSLSGDKTTKKMAYRHSGYPGGLTRHPDG